MFDEFRIPSNTQIIAFDVNLRKEKWLVALICKAPSQHNKYFLLRLINLLGKYSTHYEKVIVLGNFNLETENKEMRGFSQEVMYTIWWNKIHVLKAINVLVLIY